MGTTDATGSTLLAWCGIALASTAVLLANRPLLLDCLVVWVDTAWQQISWLVPNSSRRVQNQLTLLANEWLTLRQGQTNKNKKTEVLDVFPAAVLLSGLDRLAKGYVHRRHRRPSPRPSTRRLCPNGDHSNAEETRIVVHEHMVGIVGTVLVVLVLSWLILPSSQLTQPQTPPRPQPRTRPRPPAQPPAQALVASEVVDGVPDSARFDYADRFRDLPRPYYARPPSQFPAGSDPGVGRFRRNPRAGDLVVRPSSGRPVVDLPPLGASGFAAARKAARAAQAAQIDAAASAYVAAVRQRIVAENDERDAAGGGLHAANDARDAEAALAARVLGLDSTSEVDGLFPQLPE